MHGLRDGTAVKVTAAEIRKTFQSVYSEIQTPRPSMTHGNDRRAPKGWPEDQNGLLQRRSRQRERERERDGPLLQIQSPADSRVGIDDWHF